MSFFYIQYFMGRKLKILRRLLTMLENLHNFMQVGIVHFMAYPNAISGEEYLHTLSSIIEDDFFS